MRRTAFATFTLLCAAAVTLSPAILGRTSLLVAQSSPSPLPPNFIQVTAPTAQRLVVQTKAAHPEISKLGFHATPPNASDNAIIGSDSPAKIGKKSSPKDMEKLAGGKPTADRIEKDGIFDLLLPISDHAGNSIGDGFVVMEVPFKNAATEAEALHIGVAIRDQMQQQIASKDALYQ